jgi:hypothetical protein
MSTTISSGTISGLSNILNQSIGNAPLSSASVNTWYQPTVDTIVCCGSVGDGVDAQFYLGPSTSSYVTIANFHSNSYAGSHPQLFFFCPANWYWQINATGTVNNIYYWRMI